MKLYYAIKKRDEIMPSDDNNTDCISMQKTLEEEIESVRVQYGPNEPIEIYKVTFKKILTARTGE